MPFCRASGLLETENGEEIYDLQHTDAADAEIIGTVFDLYNLPCREIVDCIVEEV